MTAKSQTKNESKNESKNLLKKNKSAYMFFCIEERSNINSENLGLDNKDIVREIAKRWGSIKEDPEKLERYNKLALEDKERYLSEKSSGNKTASIKKTKDVVKKSKVAKDNIEEDKKVVKKKTTTKNKVGKKSEEKHDEEEEVEIEVETEDKKEVNIESEEKVVEDSSVKKTKVNAYVNYCKENREKFKKENPKLLPKEVTSELSKKWKSFSDEEKEKYKHVNV